MVLIHDKNQKGSQDSGTNKREELYTHRQSKTLEQMKFNVLKCKYIIKTTRKRAVILIEWKELISRLVRQSKTLE